MRDKSRHHRTEFPVFDQRLDGCDLCALRVNRQYRAGIYRLAIKQYRAGTAGTAIAHSLGPGDVERTAQRVQQGHARLQFSAQFLAINVECDRDLPRPMNCDFFSRGLDHVSPHDKRNSRGYSRDFHEVAPRDPGIRFGLVRVVVGIHSASSEKNSEGSGATGGRRNLVFENPIAPPDVSCWYAER